MTSITNYILIAITVSVFGFMGYQEYRMKSYEVEIAKLKTDIAEKQNKILILEDNIKKANISIQKQNEVLAMLKLEYDKKTVELEQWKNKPPKVRYEVIYQTIEGAKDDSCESVLDAVRTLDPNSL